MAWDLPKDQPPNHYRLLAIDLFESDPEVIRDGAEQRMTHVRKYQLGKHSALSQKILNELAAAKVCLLDSVKKAAYDATLRAKIAPVVQPAPLPAPDLLSVEIQAQPCRPPTIPTAETKAVRGIGRGGSRNDSSSTDDPHGVAVIACASAIVIVVRWRGPSPERERRRRKWTPPRSLAIVSARTAVQRRR